MTARPVGTHTSARFLSRDDSPLRRESLPVYNLLAASGSSRAEPRHGIGRLSHQLKAFSNHNKKDHSQKSNKHVNIKSESRTSNYDGPTALTSSWTRPDTSTYGVSDELHEREPDVRSSTMVDCEATPESTRVEPVDLHSLLHHRMPSLGERRVHAMAEAKPEHVPHPTDFHLTNLKQRRPGPDKVVGLSGFCSTSDSVQSIYERYRRNCGYSSSWSIMAKTPRPSQGVPTIETAQKVLLAICDNTHLNDEKSIYYNNVDHNFLTTEPRSEISSTTRFQVLPADHPVAPSVQKEVLCDHRYDIRVDNLDSKNPSQWVDSSPGGGCDGEEGVRATPADDFADVASAEESAEEIVEDGVFLHSNLYSESTVTLKDDPAAASAKPPSDNFSALNSAIANSACNLFDSRHITLSDGERISLDESKFSSDPRTKSSIPSSAQTPIGGRTLLTSSVCCLPEHPGAAARHLSFPSHSPLPRSLKARASTSPAIMTRPSFPEPTSSSAHPVGANDSTLGKNAAGVDSFYCPSAAEFKPEMTSTPNRPITNTSYEQIEETLTVSAVEDSSVTLSGDTVAEKSSLVGGGVEPVDKPNEIHGINFVKLGGENDEHFSFNSSAETLPAETSAFSVADARIDVGDRNEKIVGDSTLSFESEDLNGCSAGQDVRYETLSLDSLVEKLKRRTSPAKRPRGKNTSARTPKKPKIVFKESWAKRLSGLWQFQERESLDAEKNFNWSLAERKPHCAVCQFLIGGRFGDGGDEKKTCRSSTSSRRSIPVKSVPVINALEKHKTRKRRLSPARSGAQVASPLLQCRNCFLVVHASCYCSPEVVNSRGSEITWECDACQLHPGGLDCCLCALRGGPLKRAISGEWVHSFCFFAAAAADTASSRPSASVVYDISRILPQVVRRTCSLCVDVVDAATASHAKGACVTCQDLTCERVFHPTCALASGKVEVTAEVDRKGDVTSFALQFLCSGAHEQNRDFNSTSEETLKDIDVDDEADEAGRPTAEDVFVGQTVVAPFKGNKYFLARIVSFRPTFFYKIYFEDGTLSRDVYPSDIQNFPCGPDYDPPVNAKVFVKWDDGSNYVGRYLGKIQTEEVEVASLADGARETTTRRALYLPNASLPKSVKKRFFGGGITDSGPSLSPPKAESQGKRIRKANRKYDNDDTICF